MIERESAPHTIWVVEDDEGAQFIYQQVLGTNYELLFFDSLQAFNMALSSTCRPPKLIIADLALPDGSFLTALEAPTGTMKEAAILVISSMDDTEMLNQCFARGAIDYITKPFGRAELSVKVERFFRQFPGAATATAPSEISLDPKRLTVLRNGSSTPSLTPKEFQIIAVLISAPEWKVAREEILDRIWGQVSVTPKTLDVHLVNLRKKIAGCGIEINFVAPNFFQLKVN